MERDEQPTETVETYCAQASAAWERALVEMRATPQREWGDLVAQRDQIRQSMVEFLISAFDVPADQATALAADTIELPSPSRR